MRLSATVRNMISRLSGETLMVRSLDAVLLPVLQAAAAKLPPGAPVLDVGAKRAPYRALLGNVKYRTLDIRPEARPDIVGDIHELTECVPADTFDMVICTEVMEHLRDPARALRQLRSVLKPGGLLLASTPFIVPYHPDPTDYWRFTEEAWKLMLSEWSATSVVRHGNQLQCLWYLAGMGYGQPLRLLDRTVFTLSRPWQPRNTYLGLLVTAVR